MINPKSTEKMWNGIRKLAVSYWVPLIKILPVMDELSLKHLFSRMTGNKLRVRALRERAPWVCLE